jgi:uroporphyrin-III C-methyltransferase
MDNSKSEIYNKQKGKVTLVGFGPGDPDLLTLGGERAIANADIIFYDDLIDSTFLENYSAEKIYVGKRCHRHSHEQDEINQLMVDAAYAQKNVVRLKGGDPMIFGHGGEEIEFLKKNNIEVKVIPGISTGTAVAALTQVPLTHRGISSSVAFITGHRQDLLLPNADTLVCYMAGSTIHKIAIQAIAEGRKPETPVMLVHNVSYPDQKEFYSTLQALSEGEETYPTPIIIVIGDVVALSDLPTGIPQNSMVEKDDYDDFMGSLNQTHLNWGI